jgi:hypothetical protein
MTASELVAEILLSRLSWLWLTIRRQYVRLAMPNLLGAKAHSAKATVLSFAP